VDWSGRRVLVTGGEGFIGSHLVERLVHEGAEVRTLVQYNAFGRFGWLDPAVHVEVRVIPGDVRDAGRVGEAVDGCEVVFHLAALIGIPYSYVAPESYVQVNVEGTSNVALACRTTGVSRLVHTSTSETYGSALRVPIDEDHPLQPQSPYSASKIGGDMMALSYWHAFELPVAVVRPFNTYGPRQSTRAVIPTILTQLHGGATEIRLGATAPTRDFNYVDDTVSGFLAVAACDRAVGSVVNIGSGREVSIGQLGRGGGRPRPRAPGRQRGRPPAVRQHPRPRVGRLDTGGVARGGPPAHLRLGEGEPPPPRHRGLCHLAPSTFGCAVASQRHNNTPKRRLLSGGRSASWPRRGGRC
jgi:NAD dependent epimerase/dehydratase